METLVFLSFLQPPQGMLRRNNCKLPDHHNLFAFNVVEVSLGIIKDTAKDSEAYLTENAEPPC